MAINLERLAAAGIHTVGTGGRKISAITNAAGEFYASSGVSDPADLVTGVFPGTRSGAGKLVVDASFTSTETVTYVAGTGDLVPAGATLTNNTGQTIFLYLSDDV